MDIDLAQRLVGEIEPAAAVERVRRLAGGESSAAVYEVRFAGGRGVVVKLYSELLHWKLEKEVFVYGLLERAGVPAPRILTADDSRRLVNHPYAVMTRLPGRSARDVAPTLGADEAAPIDRQLGVALRAIHELRLDAFGYVVKGIPRAYATNAAYMGAQFDARLREFVELGGDQALAEAVERFVGDRRELLAACSQPVLCHNDFHEANVLIARRRGEWRLTGVLDVENAVAGDPLLDLAKTDYYSLRDDPLRRRAFFDGYGALPARREEALRLYRLYHALELWDWYAYLGVRDPLPALAEDVRALAR